jgi:hypothetical protein
MLNAFKNTTLNAFKTAYLYDVETKEKKPFKYRLMTDKEIDELQYMRGLDSMRSSMTIATNSSLEFDTKSRLIIDGFFYSVITITEMVTDNFNGMFRNTTEKTKFLAVQQ